MKYHHHKPNRNSLIKDDLNNSAQGQLVENVWSLGSFVREVMNGKGVDVIKMDIEGAEVGMFKHIELDELKEIANTDSTDSNSNSSSTADNFELLVYYHLDKEDNLQLYKFDEFLTKLESLFKLAQPLWTPMVPKPEAGGALGEWRSKVKDEVAKNVKMEDRVMGRKEGIGMASKKCDILVYCRGLRV